MEERVTSLVNRGLFLEKQFAQNRCFGNPKAGLFQYKEGSIPVVVSAPHTVRQIRNGTHKKADMFTGSLAILLHELTNCHVIYRTYTGRGDANRDIDCPYKAHLIKRIEENEISYLIDLHGMREDRNFDIDVGTLNGKSTNWNLERIILDSFNNFGITDVRFDYLFDADKKGTVTNTIWNEIAIPSFQIEINGIYRNIKLKKNYYNFYRLVSSLEYLILSLRG
ncbi:hypothetical protein [Alkaliphilus transvaalensis]|uniref:hypothetical protein n=1 Tax=Alkaliphilus transvaalensis TaxID=114628 RepID=UPI000685AB58|nr:hypothetical protein [Alkaliphilus transvaalensis]